MCIDVLIPFSSPLESVVSALPTGLRILNLRRWGRLLALGGWCGACLGGEFSLGSCWTSRLLGSLDSSSGRLLVACFAEVPGVKLMERGEALL